MRKAHVGASENLRIEMKNLLNCRAAFCAGELLQVCFLAKTLFQNRVFNFVYKKTANFVLILFRCGLDVCPAIFLNRNHSKPVT